MSMQITSLIQKWGNGLGLRVSGALREIPGFEAGMPVIIEVLEDGFRVRKIQTSTSPSPFDYTEDELIASISETGIDKTLLMQPSPEE